MTVEAISVVGWDVGGAHLKMVALNASGQVAMAREFATPLWQGLDSLRAALNNADTYCDWRSARHAVTMTGELCDAFTSRHEGVMGLTAEMVAALGPSVQLYAGAQGWVLPRDVAGHTTAIASANWHATATWVAQQITQGVLIDIGSTTTDIVPFSAGACTATGVDDYSRLRVRELYYTGVVRTPLMSLPNEVPFDGAVLPAMREYFATMADVYRITGELDEASDLHPAADNAEKTVRGSTRRLARMVGLDASQASDAAWLELAHWYAGQQLEQVDAALRTVLARTAQGAGTVLVCAGAGAFVAHKLGPRLGVQCVSFESLLPGGSDARMASVCAPAYCVASLLQ
jgi:(4-(4-[2-(gamma-L-glutamylamino)ethyl]phenoxymethyl)furan-2-yl)methanamine synthase